MVVLKRNSIRARVIATQLPVVGAVVRFFVAAEACRIGQDYTSYVKVWFK